MCTCRGRHLCDYHADNEQKRVDAVNRSNNNRLTALARNLELPDEQWCKLMYLYETDDLDRLLFEGEAS